MAANTPDYKRYRDTESGVSPMAIPGTPGTVYTADGLEHTEGAIPSSQSRDHTVQLDKRERKLMRHDYGSRWADVEGDGEAGGDHFRLGLGAGARSGATRRAPGREGRLMVLRLLAPLQPEVVEAALAGVERVMVVEQNHGAQLLRYLRGMLDLPPEPVSFHRPGPLSLRPGDICDAIFEWSGKAVACKEAA